MNKKLSIIIALFLGGLGFFLGSCSDDDKNNNQVSQEWIDYQKNKFDDVVFLKDDKGKEVYAPLQVDLAVGLFIYERPSVWIKDILEGKFDKNGPYDFDPAPKVEAEKREVIEKIKYDTDVAVVRYHGWFYDLEGKRRIFDSTETDLMGGRLNNPKAPAEFEVGPGLIEGFRSALYSMKVGDEKLISVPNNLAYASLSQGIIPGYTTLFFDILLLEVKRD